MVFRSWALGLGFALVFVIIVFGYQAAFLGLIAGAPVGFVLRKTWKVNENMPNLGPKEEYPGD